MESIHTHRGFTLIELLVVLAIIGVVTMIVFTSQGSFNRTIIVANTAYDIALTLRSAETYGLASRGAGAVVSGQSGGNVGYGLHFDKTVKNSFILFADSSPGVSSFGCHAAIDTSAPSAEPGDCAYQAGQDQKVSPYALNNGIIISDFCVYPAGSATCASTGLASLDITFARPNPTPFIYSGSMAYNFACITISAPAGGSRYVTVNSAGMISANAASCP